MGNAVARRGGGLARGGERLSEADGARTDRVRCSRRERDDDRSASRFSSQNPTITLRRGDWQAISTLPTFGVFGSRFRRELGIQFVAAIIGKGARESRRRGGATSRALLEQRGLEARFARRVSVRDSRRRNVPSRNDARRGKLGEPESSRQSPSRARDAEFSSAFGTETKRSTRRHWRRFRGR